MGLWSRVRARRDRANSAPEPVPRLFADTDPERAIQVGAAPAPPPPPSGELAPGATPGTPERPAGSTGERAEAAPPSLSHLVERRMDQLFASGDGAVTVTSPDEAEGGPFDEESTTDLISNLAPSVVPEPGEPDALRMFCEITRAYIAPVRRFIEQLRRGPAPAAGLELHRPAMEMVVRAAERLPVGDLVAKLSRFTSALQGAVESRDATIDEPHRTRILDAYAALERALPAAFRIEEGTSPAEDVILLALLKQIPDVGTVTLDKIFGAGLTSIEQFAEATPRDLAITAGISESLATRICVRVQGYLVSRARVDDVGSRAEAAAKLATLIAELREAHQAYEALRREDRVRWAHRRRRLDLALSIQVALAELGERGLLDALLPLSYEKRIDRLVRYVESIGGKVPRPAVRGA